MTAIHFDTTHFPTVKIVIGNYKGKNDFEIFIDSLESLFVLCQERHSKMFLIFDASNVDNLDFQLVPRMAKYMLSNEEKERMYIEEIFFILSTSFARKMLSMLFEMKSPISKYHFCSSFKEVNTILNQRYLNMTTSQTPQMTSRFTHTQLPQRSETPKISHKY